ncbi:MAG: UDP-glucose 4-epimerase, partial [Thermoprotei archaeon]
MKKVVVTGGAGFIGSYLVEALLARNYNVTILDNLSSGSLRNIEGVLGNPNLEIIKGDIRDKNA